MLGTFGRFLAREIDLRALVRVMAVAVVLVVAAIVAALGRTSMHRDDLEVVTSILVIAVLVYGIYAALNAEPPDKPDRPEAGGTS
jgi:uncharacterized membrane protein YfcA